MKILKLIPVLFIVLFSSCEKEVVQPYAGGDRVQFRPVSTNPNIRYIENIAFSFAGKGAIEEHMMQIPIQIIGDIREHDRKVAITVDPEKTNAIEGVDYILSEDVIPANESRGYINVKLLKTDALETDIKVLSLRIVENEFFKPGDKTQLASTISFYNQLVKPVDWDAYMARYFGAYSKRKHEFILFYLEIPEINFAIAGQESKENHKYSGTDMLYFQIRLRSILSDLNNGVIAPKENDPFTYPLMDADVNGNRIVFP
ncbi:MAG: DUF4843 domain-containing protein [Sphingobacterium sp.]|jgi:hypothetical protein|nr:DUF4843 domain-containing protein [Sphingobacterium sp.]